MGSRMKWRENNTENPLRSNSLLFQCAIDAFSSQSFGEASLNEIIKSANLNKGSFYYRFHDKTDLYLSLMSLIIDEKSEMLTKLNDSDTNNDFFALLEKQAKFGLMFAREHPKYEALWKRVMIEDKKIRLIIEEEFGIISSNQLASMISYAIEQKEIRSDVSPELLANIVVSFLDGLEATLKPSDNDEMIMLLVKQTVMLLREGLRRV